MSDLTRIRDLLNTRDDRRFTIHGRAHVPHDDLADLVGLERFLGERDLLHSGEPVTPADLRLAVEVRERLRAVVGGAAAEPLRDLRLAVAFDRGRPRLEPLEAGAAGALARIAIEAVLAQERGDWDRLRLCAAEDCRYAFVDTGRNRLGRWCSMRVCGNRVKTRAYRRRR